MLHRVDPAAVVEVARQSEERASGHSARAVSRVTSTGHSQPTTHATVILGSSVIPANMCIETAHWV